MGHGFVWLAQAAVIAKVDWRSIMAGSGARSAMTASTTSLLPSSVTTSASGQSAIHTPFVKYITQ